MNSMPENWTPPAPAWRSLWQDDNESWVCGIFAIQGDSPLSLEDWAQRAFIGNSAPKLLEQGKFHDNTGKCNFIYIGYWRQADYQKWWVKEKAWWSSAEIMLNSLSVWREIIIMPTERLETLHSSENNHGLACLASELEGPILEHGYPGAARERIPCSSLESIKNKDDIWRDCKIQVEDNGRRVIIKPPKNICVIRSGQDWSHSGEEQKKHYLTRVHPILKKGMQYLSNNPIESNCASMRFVTKTNENWLPLEQSFGLGYATDIYAFEKWAKSHPTHLAIFDRFLQMADRYNENLELRLWHEMTVIPDNGCEFEYINCHSNTGLLAVI